MPRRGIHLVTCRGEHAAVESGSENVVEFKKPVLWVVR